VVGQLDGGGVLAGDGSPVGNDSDSEVLEHRGENWGVKRSPKEKGSSGTVPSMMNVGTGADKRWWGVVRASCAFQ
jgi:hypothetical protein